VKQKDWTVDEDRWQRRISNSEDSSDPARARRSHANRLNVTGGAALPLFVQALTTPVQERSRLLDAPSTGEQSRERVITQPDARLDERDGAGDRIPNRRLIHRYG